MGWLIFGAVLLAAGLHPFIWQLFTAMNDGDRNWMAVIRTVLVMVGSIFIAFNFPDITNEGINSPGALVFGLILLPFFLGTYFWKQMSPLWERKTDDDGYGRRTDPIDDYFLPWHIIRFVGVIAAVLAIAIGVGNGPPDPAAVDTKPTVEVTEENHR